jgi:CBS domain-containing protein
VIEGNGSGKLVGLMTDYDMVTMIMAEGKDASKTMVKSCMSTSPVMIMGDMDIEKCCEMMEEKEVRRMPVCDKMGNCIGMVSMADVAQKAEMPPMMMKQMMQTVAYV